MPINHNLTTAQIQTEQALVDQGNISEAWQYLADLGDTYADDAANVTGDPEEGYFEKIFKSNRCD